MSRRVSLLFFSSGCAFLLPVPQSLHSVVEQGRVYRVLRAGKNALNASTSVNNRDKKSSLSAPEAPPGVLAPGLVPSVKEGHGSAGASSEEATRLIRMGELGSFTWRREGFVETLQQTLQSLLWRGTLHREM